MTDFFKQKLAYALALLATAFSVSPVLLGEAGGFSFAIFGWDVSLRLAYYVFVGLLGSAVYLFGFQLITERHMGALSKGASLAFGAALTIPALYLALLISTGLAAVAGRIAASFEVRAGVQLLLAAVAGALAALGTQRFTAAFTRLERASQNRVAEQSETATLRLARSLVEADLSDLAVVRLFRAVEAAGQRAVLQSGLEKESMYRRRWKRHMRAVLPAPVLPKFEHLAALWNIASNQSRTINRDEAYQAISHTSQVLAALTASSPEGKVRGRCKKCGSEDQHYESGYDSSGFFYEKLVCAACGVNEPID